MIRKSYAFTAKGSGSISGCRTKILQAKWHSQKTKIITGGKKKLLPLGRPRHFWQLNKAKKSPMTTDFLLVIERASPWLVLRVQEKSGKVGWGLDYPVP